MNAPNDNRTATPSPAEGEGRGEADMLDTVERLGSWRTNGKYDIGVAQRLTGVSANSIKDWLKSYPSCIADLKPSWKDGMGRSWTNLTRLSFIELVEILVAGKIRAAQGSSYKEVRKYHDTLASEWGTQFPFAHQSISVSGGQLHTEVIKTLEQFDYEDSFVSRWCPLGKDGALALDPRRAGGQPAFKGRRLRVVDIRDYFIGGDSIESLARDFDLTPLDVEAALRYALKVAP